MLLCLDLGPIEKKTRAKNWPDSPPSQYFLTALQLGSPVSLKGSIHIQLSRSASSHDPSKTSEIDTFQHYHVERVTKRVDQLLRKAIKGLSDLSIQVEGSEGMQKCCLT